MPEYQPFCLPDSTTDGFVPQPSPSPRQPSPPPPSPEPQDNYVDPNPQYPARPPANYQGPYYYFPEGGNPQEFVYYAPQEAVNNAPQPQVPQPPVVLDRPYAEMAERAFDDLYRPLGYNAPEFVTRFDYRIAEINGLLEANDPDMLMDDREALQDELAHLESERSRTLRAQHERSRRSRISSAISQLNLMFNRYLPDNLSQPEILEYVIRVLRSQPHLMGAPL